MPTHARSERTAGPAEGPRQTGQSSVNIENNTAGLARPVSSLFKNFVISADGAPHFRSDAADYQTYTRRAKQMSEHMVCTGLPHHGEEVIKYNGDG